MKIFWPFKSAKYCITCYGLKKASKKSITLNSPENQIYLSDATTTHKCASVLISGEFSENSDKISHRSRVIMAKVNLELKDPLKIYNLVSKMGDGGSSSVFRATHKRTGLEVALKRIKIKDSRQMNDVLKEIGILKSSDHENIIQYYCAYQYKR